MFWNLVRYEFKNVNKWYLALYAAVLVLSALIGIQTQGFKNLPYQESQATMLLFLATVFGGLMLTLAISTIFLIIKRFKGSVYDRQGYLTLTLPVSEHHIITAKLIGAFIWSLDSFSMNTVQHSLLQPTLVSKSSLDLLNFSSILVLISMSIHW